MRPSLSILFSVLLSSFIFIQTILIPTATAADLSTHSLILIWDSENLRSERVPLLQQEYPDIQFRNLRALNRITVITSSGSRTALQLRKKLDQLPGIHAYPDPVVSMSATPDDLFYSDLWGINNSSDSDINAPEAWDIQTGNSNVVVGILDTGVDYTHTDLAANIWTNPFEIAGNGIDDDNNGWVDDIHGIDTVNSDSDPYDDHGHGTHVAGTIGGKSMNSQGIAGVNWQTSLIACKFLDADGYGEVSGAITCLDYFLTLKNDAGINIVATNNSWGGSEFSQPLQNAIHEHGMADILFIAAAGNSSADLSETPDYPALIKEDNIIVVASHDDGAALSWFSNFSDEFVDIAAPGESVLSTVPGDSYESWDGTSMATPHVSGAVALLAAQFPDTPNLTFRTLLQGTNATASALDGKVADGRLRLWESDATGALNCSDMTLVRNLREHDISVKTGNSVTLSFSAQNCVTPETSLTLYNRNGDITLHDNGVTPDLVAGDGIFSAAVIADWTGTRTYSASADSSQSVVITAATLPDIYEVDYYYTDISDSNTAEYLNDDDGFYIYPAFDVMLPNGETTTQIFVSSNGLINFDGVENNDFSNQELPAYTDSHIVYPYWDDLYPPDGGPVRYSVRGSTPNRELIVEYDGIPNIATPPENPMTFQVIFYEYKDEIRINYKDVNVGSDTYSYGATATVGYETAGTATQFSFNEISLHDEMSLIIGENDVPTITRFEITDGMLRPNRTLTFVGEAEPSTENPEPMELFIDLDNGEGDQPYTSGTEVYEAYAIGEYTAILTAVQGSSENVSYLDFEVIDYTDDEKTLMDESFEDGKNEVLDNPDDYDLADPDDTIAEVQANPGEYDLADIMNTSEDLEALPAGTYLLGASVDIDDMGAYFTDSIFVWTYREGEYLGWAPDPEDREKLSNSGYSPLESLSAGEGFWLIK